MKNQISRFEDRIQRLIEGGFARLFAGRLHPREVAVQLARAMEDYAVFDSRERHIAPDTYLVRLNPHDHTAILDAQPGLTAALGEELIELARLAGLLMLKFPEVRLLADAAIEPHQVTIQAQHSKGQKEITEALPLSTYEDELPEAPEAFLVLNGDQHIVIDRPVLNLGRQRDNHIILDDPRVSRHHAQIRLRFGQYVVYDLGSTGGTQVNQKPVQQWVLQPGDVISLSGVSLIYGEEGNMSSDEGTRPCEPETP